MDGKQGMFCLLVFQGRWNMPVTQRRGKEKRRICLCHRMWVFQLFQWAIFPKPWNVFSSIRQLDVWVGGLFPLLITMAILEEPFNFSGINSVPQHLGEVQGWNVAIDGLWEKAPEWWLYLFPGHGEMQKIIIYIYICTYMYIHICVYMCVYVYTHIRIMYIYIIYVCTYNVCMCVCVYVYVCMYVYMCIHIYNYFDYKGSKYFLFHLHNQICLKWRNFLNIKCSLLVTVVSRTWLISSPKMRAAKIRALQCRRPRFDPWVGKYPGEGNDHPL